jgi:hypothetical protein
MSSNATPRFATLGTDVHQALRDWQGDSNAPSPLGYLYLFRQAQPIDKPALTAKALVEKLLKQLLPDAALAGSSSVEKMLALLRTRLKLTPHLIVVDPPPSPGGGGRL